DMLAIGVGTCWAGRRRKYVQNCQFAFHAFPDPVRCNRIWQGCTQFMAEGRWTPGDTIVAVGLLLPRNGRIACRFIVATRHGKSRKPVPAYGAAYGVDRHGGSFARFGQPLGASFAQPSPRI